MSGLPTPPMDQKPHLTRPSKTLKQHSRTSKRPNPVHNHSAAILDGRHKRVWKACERCRMKKTKCDGESPCKRCKDDGLVCTAGSRKKTEFKQLPRGYAEVLENTQYALIATVQKLYTMVRNSETWDLGEPELNDRGQPVIHDIASRLGCIRSSPDLPYAFPEGAGDFADLQAQLQAARHDMGSEDTGSRKHSSDASAYSPPPERTDRASSSDSDHSNNSKEYNQMLWSQRQVSKIAPQVKAPNPTPLHILSRQSFEESQYQPRMCMESAGSMPSPVYTDFQTESPMFRNASPFAPWSGGGEYLGQGHALGMTSNYLLQQTAHQSSPLSQPNGNFDAFKAMQANDCLNFAEGTIRPNMLDYNTLFDIGISTDQMDNIIYNGADYRI